MEAQKSASPFQLRRAADFFLDPVMSPYWLIVTVYREKANSFQMPLWRLLYFLDSALSTSLSGERNISNKDFVIPMSFSGLIVMIPAFMKSTGSSTQDNESYCLSKNILE
jgi:hypothetical protein